MALKAKEQAFVDEYLRDFNATEAYKRAGYKSQGRAAGNNASRLMGKDRIQEAIRAAMAQRAQAAGVTKDRVEKEFCCIAFSDLRRVFLMSPTGLKLKPLVEWPDEEGKSIASIKIRREITGRGEQQKEYEIMEFKRDSKTDALDKLAKHLDYYNDATAAAIALLVERELARIVGQGHGQVSGGTAENQGAGNPSTGEAVGPGNA